MMCRVGGETGRIQSLDVLRVLAVGCLVIHHLNDYTSRLFTGPLDKALTFISLGTLVYVSGHVLAHKYGVLDSLSAVRRFVNRRFLRIYPLYLLALLLFTFCSFLPYRSLPRDALLLSMLWGTPVATLWFVEMICLYYLLLPLITFRVGIRGLIIRGCLIGAVLTGIHLFWGVLEVRLVLYWPVFFLGVVAARDERLSALMKKRWFPVISAVLCGVSALLCLRWAVTELRYLPRLVFTLAALPPVLSAGQAIASRVNYQIFLHLSYASYCMYLFHRVVFWLLLQAYHPATAPATLAYLALLGLPSLYLIAVQIQTLYDRAYTRATAPSMTA